MIQFILLAVLVLSMSLALTNQANAKHHHDIKQDTPRNSDMVTSPAKPMNLTGYVLKLAQQCEEMPGGNQLPEDKLANLVNKSLMADNITPVLQTCGNYLTY